MGTEHHVHAPLQILHLLEELLHNELIIKPTLYEFFTTKTRILLPCRRVCQQQYLFPPVALNLMCRAVIPSSLQRWATSWAANMAAYGEDSSLSAFTFIPPVTRQIVSLATNAAVRQHAAITSESDVLVGTFTYLPDRSVTWTKVSLKEAKMWHTPNTFSPSATWGPRLITCSSFFSFPLRGAIVWRWRANPCQSHTSILLAILFPELSIREPGSDINKRQTRKIPSI